MITIMTPTYNRAYILPKTYESLKNQTSFDFEWVIVDDGSKDDTEQLVGEWIKTESNFVIVYKKQENGGKHRAVNAGVKLAKYDYFLILDSDDTLTPDAVEKMHSWIADIEGLDGFAGVSGMKGYDNAAPVGKNIRVSYIDATNLERKKYGLLGDKAEVYKTEILKQYPFPEFEGENFIRESAVWDHIAKDGFKIRWFNDIIYICDYIEDGLTKNTSENTYVKNFQGYLYCTKLFLETHTGISCMNRCGHFYRIAKLRDIKKKDARNLVGVNWFFFYASISWFELKQLLKSFISRIKGNRK